jgi:hypothetical protein
MLIDLVLTFDDMRKSKLSSFNRSLYTSSAKTTRFYSTLIQMYEHLQSDATMPTLFHMFVISDHAFVRNLLTRGIT